MTLPAAWVDRIHARLLVRYGAAWLAKWRGIDESAVRADWADVLGGMSDAHIRHALENLPIDKPPTAGEFVALGRGLPSAFVPALPAPRATDEIVKRAMSAVRRVGRASPLQMFHDLKRREEAGERLTQAQRDMWRAALERKGGHA